MQNNHPRFLLELRKRAGEQRALMDTTIFPSWLGPVNAWLATNAFSSVFFFAFFVSMLIFVVWFQPIYTLGQFVVGK